MHWILEGAAVLCLLYYAVIVQYSGFAVSFSLLWPLLAGILVIADVGLRLYHRKSELVPLWIPVSFITAIGACALIFMITEALIGWNLVTSREQHADYMIVLGAKTEGNTPKASLKSRLDRAIEYSQDYPNTVLVLSGGKSEGAEVSEARVMYEYLLEQGISPSQMLIEDQSLSTAENIEFSCKVIERQEHYKAQAARAHLREKYRARSDGDEIRVGVLTSDYHLFRARSIAKKQGIWNPVGIAAFGDPVLALHMWVREGFAVLKDKFMGRL